MFASAFVMLARSLNIPTRYVTGYCGHEWNGLGKFITIRECDAHAWAEVYIKNSGWITIEPTPSNELLSILKDNRNWGEDYIDSFSEWWRLTKNYLVTISIENAILTAFLFMALILMLYLSYIFIRTLMRKSKNKYRFATNIEISAPELKKIWENFNLLINRKIRYKYENETLREYFSFISPYLHSECKLFMNKLIVLIEEELYNESKTKTDSIKLLYSDWENLKQKTLIKYKELK